MDERAEFCKALNLNTHFILPSIIQRYSYNIGVTEYVCCN